MFLIRSVSVVCACREKPKQENCTMRMEFHRLDYLEGWCVKHCIATLTVEGWSFYPSDF